MLGLLATYKEQKTSRQKYNDKITHFIVFYLWLHCRKIDLKVIPISPISRLNRICACLNSLINLVWVSIHHFDTFYSINTILLYLITLLPFNQISRLSQICACLTSLTNIIWVSFDKIGTFYSRNTIFILKPLNCFHPISKLNLNLNKIVLV